MAKKALLDVLEETIGKYVKNLDAESLNVAVWSGKIALNSLELDVDAVNAELDRQAAEAPNLALPLQVVSGSFDSFEVDVPWASLTSRSVVLRAKGLHIQLEPHSKRHRQQKSTDLWSLPLRPNEESRAAQIRQARQKSLESSEQYRQQTYAVRKLANTEQTDANSKSTFSSRLVRRIIENLQIEIQDVQFSLKDAQGDSAAGVVLESLALVTTDPQGNQVFVDRTSASSKKSSSQTNEFLYKKLLMQGFGIYLDNHDEHERLRFATTTSTTTPKASTGGLTSIDEFHTPGHDYPSTPDPNNTTVTSSDSNQHSLDFTAGAKPQHSYILAPLTFQAKLRQADGSVCVDYAKYQFVSELSSLSVLLSRHQLELARKLSGEVSITGAEGTVDAPLFPEYRPLTRVHNGQAAREWWKYALRAIGRLNGRRSWPEFFLAFQKRKRYIPLYKRHAHHSTCPWIQPLNSVELEELVALDQDRGISVQGIMAWRNIADAQVDRERDKHEEATKQQKQSQTSTTTSYFSSIFRTSSGNTSKPAIEEEKEVEDHAPIQLTAEELKELETMSTQEFEEPELSKDSKLYDLNFVLKSLRVGLISHDLRYLSSLEMGAVGLDFAADANGSFRFNFNMTNLEILDKTTPNTLFPSILRNIPSTSTDTNETGKEAAFHLHLSKEAAGDQSLKLKLAAFEAVASQILFKDLEYFFSEQVSATARYQLAHKSKANPILAQSMSGSVDLFYDADQGASMMQPTSLASLKEEEEMPATALDLPKLDPLVDKKSTTTNSSKTDFSSVLVDAWKEKAATKATWQVDVDINAPVLVIPEKCTDPRASVLVCDFGRFNLTYGQISASPVVQDWFRKQQVPGEPEISVDSGTVAVSELTLQVGRVQDYGALVNSKTSAVGESRKETSLVDPISLSLDLGVDGGSSSVDSARLCCIGLIPSISMRLSPKQGAKVISVVGAWSSYFEEGDNDQHDHESNKESIPVPTGTLSTQSMAGDGSSSGELAKASEGGRHGSSERIYVSIGLQRLSATVSLDEKNQVEAHLVSVYTSAQMMMDGSSTIALRMGWFWILDLLETTHARRQRLLAHSTLPASPESFITEGNFNILEKLTQQGVFDVGYKGSSELADISWAKGSTEYFSDAMARQEEYVESTLDAKFASLFIHWNPWAVKAVNEVLEKLMNLSKELDDQSSTVILLGEQQPPKSRAALASIPEEAPPSRSNALGKTVVHAQMQSLEINLNSARDDFPLITFTVSRAKIDLSSSKEALELTAAFGDICIGTDETMGRTLPTYRTLLGLSPGQSKSLLTVKYLQGKDSKTFLTNDQIEKFQDEKVEAYAEIDLSPMRLYYIQSQVMALVEYCSEGILGALTASAASTAAQAAIDIADSIAGTKIFQVRATTFDLILPESAVRNNQLTVQAGSLTVDYRMRPTGSEVAVDLSKVILRGSSGDLMQEEPVQVLVNIVLPPDDVGSYDDRAMRVDVKMSSARFTIKKDQYTQILRMLEGNMGDIDLYLRDESTVDNQTGQTSHEIELAKTISTDNKLTHAGNTFVEAQRRLYLSVKVEVLALQLYDESFAPIIRLAAVKALIGYKSFPHEEASSTEVSLHNLVCEDTRTKASKRQYRHLISQDDNHEGQEDLFFIGYQSGKMSSSVELKVGSPQIVLIPDAMSEVLAFVRTEKPENKGTPMEGVDSVGTGDRELNALTWVTEDGVETIETAANFTSKVDVQTGTCRVVLVDLGSNSSAEASSTSEQLAETLVVQGVFNVTSKIFQDIITGNTIGFDFAGQAEAMQIFSAFGAAMKSPLQILEPSQASVHGSMKSNPEGKREIEIRAAALTRFDLTFSMHNAALLNAIISSLTESFDADEAATREAVLDPRGLTKTETEQIETIALALESPTSSGSRVITAQGSSRNLGDDVSIDQLSTQQSGATTIQIKMTMPEARVTVINDLQGLDEALFRVSVTNFVAGGDFAKDTKLGTTFDFHMNTNFLADYFDTSCNIWNSLLTKPWEVSLRGVRAPSRRFTSSRLSTSIDLESFSCCISFSEQFLVSLASASKMWSIYSVATALPSDDEIQSGSLKASMAASAARNLITSLPYAIENTSGLDLTFSLPNETAEFVKCKDGKIQYFRFEPPRGEGFGGKRAYGQDVNFEKLLKIRLEKVPMITIGHLDNELGLPKKTHKLSENRTIFTQVRKAGKSTVLYVSSQVSIVNNTAIPFKVAVAQGQKLFSVGVCGAAKQNRRLVESPLSNSERGMASRDATNFSIPVDRLQNFTQGWTQGGHAQLSLEIEPSGLQGVEGSLVGRIDIQANLRSLRKAENGRQISKFDVSCSLRDKSRSSSSFVVQVLLKMHLTPDKEVCVEACIEPRALIENRFPVPIKIRTPMPHTFSSSIQEPVLGSDVIYCLEKGGRVEVFTPGPSIAISVKTANGAIAGQDLDWLDGGWIDLPLVPEFSLLEPITCFLPFANGQSGHVTGNEFFVAEGEASLAELVVPVDDHKKKKKSNDLDQKLSQPSPEAPLRTFFLTVCYFGVDHTGTILFHQLPKTFRRGSTEMGTRDSFKARKRASRRDSSTSLSTPSPFPTFACSENQRRVSLLPTSNVPIQILQMTMDSEVGYRRSFPFYVEELPIGQGGIDTIPIQWENKQSSGYYAYRAIVNEHQSEVHVIPEFIIFNGSKHMLLVKERGQPEVLVESGDISRLEIDARLDGLSIALYFVELECHTSFIRVDKLGLKVAILKSNTDLPVGSVCIQTVIDTRGDARLVVKIGDISAHGVHSQAAIQGSMFENDFFRFRVRWTELQLILNELQIPSSRWGLPKSISGLSASPRVLNRNVTADHERPTRLPSSPLSPQPTRGLSGFTFNSPVAEVLQQPVATIIFSRFTFDVQRVFKEETSANAVSSPERSQISLIIHNVVIKDLTPDTPFPMVFDATGATNFLDLCVRVKGSSNADLLKIDLFDLNLAHSNGISERIKVTTSEDYVWRILDLVNRILAASGEFAGYTLRLEEDEAQGGFIVKIDESKTNNSQPDQSAYKPPSGDTLYDINIARVSPFSLLVSFKRNPQLSRYRKVNSNVRGSALMNYFSRRLKFTIDRAELNFARYEDRSLKGPPDRLMENLFAVYTSRMKFKLVTLLTSASLQDWKYLAARDNGDDEYVEGDVLRAAGNLTGKASHLLLKRAGSLIGDGVSDLSRALGNTIETTSDKIGARRVGVGLNSVVSGVGDGVGSAVTGVGTGTGKILKGAGQGLGHAIGGVAGGALQIGKGLGRGITKGDGKAMMQGFSDGVSTVGGGLAQGAESAVVGAADGFLSAGKGLFGGVKSVGKGIGGAFTGKKPKKKFGNG